MGQARHVSTFPGHVDGGCHETVTAGLLRGEGNTVIERAKGDGRLGRRLQKIVAQPHRGTGPKLASVWRPGIVALVAITAGANWQQAGSGTAHIVLVGTAVVAILVTCAGHPFDARTARSAQVEELLQTRRAPTPSIDNSLGDASALYEIKRRPASQITWVSLAKSTVPRH